MSQLFTHTPAYVWAILAVLVWRGLAEARDREVAPRRLFVIPLVMLALALYDVLVKFGGPGLAVAAWALGCAGAALAAYRFAPARIAAGSTRDRVRVRGSIFPLCLMLALFGAKYAAAAALALRPALAQQPAFTMAVCAGFGMFNGLFFGRLANDVAAWRALDARPAGLAVHS